MICAESAAAIFISNSLDQCFRYVCFQRTLKDEARIVMVEQYSAMSSGRLQSLVLSGTSTNLEWKVSRTQTN